MQGKRVVIETVVDVWDVVIGFLDVLVGFLLVFLEVFVWVLQCVHSHYGRHSYALISNWMWKSVLSFPLDESSK